ncbi:MAG TPA: class I SAM-dependent methyltransferase [Gemmatimonadaceae bacterium]|nr:class I SAM-dependent methyltransferase [Gemmatimonadaceae bacterium]
MIPRKGSYGIDAPTLLPIAGLLVLLNLFLAWFSRSWGPLIGAIVILGFLATGLYASLRGKFVVWSRVLDRLDLRGDEKIIDLGCGRGAVLLMAAQRLTTGRAVGADIWSRRDQSGNAIEATRENAIKEGVSEKVDLETADMTGLPFPSDSFDLVVSNVAIHNIKGSAGRHQAIDEALRVLRPGGRFAIADLFGTGDYVKWLRSLGVTSITRRNLGWRMWWGGPWMATHLVEGTKPVQAKT